MSRRRQFHFVKELGIVGLLSFCQNNGDGSKLFTPTFEPFPQYPGYVEVLDLAFWMNLHRSFYQQVLQRLAEKTGLGLGERRNTLSYASPSDFVCASSQALRMFGLFRWASCLTPKMWRILVIWQLELLVSAVDLFHERLEVNSAGSTVPISRPVFQSRLDGQSPIPSNGLNTIFFCIRLFIYQSVWKTCPMG